MRSIGSYVNITAENFYFNGCSSCEGACCNGAKGFVASPLILEDFSQVYTHFPILFGIDNERLMAYVLLNDEKGHCRYYENHQCSIYEHRTPACKLYPITPYFEHILVDTDCPAISTHTGKRLCYNGVLQSDFYTKRLENFVQKREESLAFYGELYKPEHFQFVGDVSGLKLFIYIKQSDSPYIQMHLESLKYFWDYFGIKPIKEIRAVS